MALLLGSILGCVDEVDGVAGNDGIGGGDDAAGDGSSADGSDDDLPPEIEETVRFDTPQAGKGVVYVPNPDTHRVAVVDAASFAIESVTTGRMPTYVATVPGEDVALVLNVGSADAALLRTTDGRTRARTFPVGHSANAIAMAPDGKHAVIYFDAARPSPVPASTFQDVTVVSLSEGEEGSRGVSVGFRPRGVQFSRDGARAFVVTEDGISIIDLARAVSEPTIARLVPFGDTLSQGISNDVQVTPSGAHALARREGEQGFRLIDLATGDVQSLSLSDLQPRTADAGTGDAGRDDAGTVDGGPGDAATVDAGSALPAGQLSLTDLDLAPDGSFALAVVRDASTLLRIPIPGGFDDPAQIQAQVIDQQIIGSVTIAPGGEVAVLYTTAAAAESVIVLDLLGEVAPRGVRLRKTVRAVALSADGSRALVLHGTSEGDPADASIDEETRIDRSEGYSLLDTATGFAKLKLTAARVGETDVLVTPDATRMFALLRDDARQVRAYETADLRSFQVDSFALGAPPSSLGLVPSSGRVFVGQEAEGGMISFLDAETGELVRPVAGFELTSGVRP